MPSFELDSVHASLWTSDSSGGKPGAGEVSDCVFHDLIITQCDSSVKKKNTQCDSFFDRLDKDGGRG